MDDSSEQMHCPAAGSRAVAPSSSLRLLEKPADPQAPTAWAMLGAAGPGQPENTPPPPFHPHRHIPTGLSFPSGYPRGLRCTVQQVKPFFLFLTRFWSS